MVGDPLAIMRDVAEQNLALWKDMQDSFLGSTMPGGTSGSSKDKETDSKS
jgi:hypothetical protein